MNLKAFFLPGGVGLFLSILFPVPMTAVCLVLAALFCWLTAWGVGVMVSFSRREYSWQACIGGLAKRFLAYTALAAGAACLTFLLAALLVEVPGNSQLYLRHIVWAPVCVVSSIIGFAETISLLRSASRLMPNEETGRQVRKWLKPFILLVKEIGERTVEGQSSALKAVPNLVSGEKDKATG